MWLIIRPELQEPYIGPFTCSDAAIGWQEADCAANGECEWSVWPLIKPSTGDEKVASLTASAVVTAEQTLREKAQGLRAMMAVDPSLSRGLNDDANEHEQVADALRSFRAGTAVILVQP